MHVIEGGTSFYWILLKFSSILGYGLVQLLLDFYSHFANCWVLSMKVLGCTPKFWIKFLSAALHLYLDGIQHFFQSCAKVWSIFSVDLGVVDFVFSLVHGKDFRLTQFGVSISWACDVEYPFYGTCYMKLILQHGWGYCILLLVLLLDWWIV